MRLLLLHNRIYRAFPELDRYTDVRCRKFLRAAQRGRIRRAFHWVLISLVFALVLVGGMAGIAWLVSVLFDAFDADKSTWPALGALLIPVFAAPVLAFLTRDGLLRRRIRFVLRSRGTCPACKYSLIGLPISPESLVQCPECSLETEVDPSLGELALDESGRARFKPAPPRPPRVFTPGRVRFLKRAAKTVAIAIGIGGPALWGGYELWLRHQAATARAEKPGVDALIALVETNQPSGSEGGANAWDVLQEVITLRGQADTGDQARYPDISGQEVYPEFTWVAHPLPANLADDERQKNEDSARKARRLVDVYRQAGVYAALDRLSRAPRVVPAMSLPPGEPMIHLAEPDLGQMRQLARINAARMALAQEGGDLVEYTSALESSLALARTGLYEPVLLDGLVGLAIEMLTYQRLQELLLSHPAPEWLDAIDAAITRQRVALPPSYQWEGGRLYALDTLAWVFSDPARVRWGRLSKELSSMMEVEGWIGTYAQNRDALNARYRHFSELASQPRGTRPSPALNLDDESGPPLVHVLAAGSDSCLRSFDQSEMRRRAYVVASALERYYAAHHAYPATLADLVPDFLPQPPLDPFTGMPWGYRLRVPDAPLEDPRGYILYSFGEDRQDNGGLRTKENNYRALSPKPRVSAGLDFIINDWQPPNPPSSP